jgi:hypothetical protein
VRTEQTDWTGLDEDGRVGAGVLVVVVYFRENQQVGVPARFPRGEGHGWRDENDI